MPSYIIRTFLQRIFQNTSKITRSPSFRYSLTRKISVQHFRKVSNPNDLNHHFKQQLIQQLYESETILISGEDLATLKPHELLKLCKMIGRAGYMIQPFAIVRPPFSLLNSAIQEQIKNGIYWPVVGLGDLIPLQPEGWSSETTFQESKTCYKCLAPH